MCTCAVRTTGSGAVATALRCLRADVPTSANSAPVLVRNKVLDAIRQLNLVVAHTVHPGLHRGDTHGRVAVYTHAAAVWSGGAGQLASCRHSKSPYACRWQACRGKDLSWAGWAGRQQAEVVQACGTAYADAGKCRPRCAAAPCYPLALPLSSPC